MFETELAPSRLATCTGRRRRASACRRASTSIRRCSSATSTCSPGIGASPATPATSRSPATGSPPSWGGIRRSSCAARTASRAPWPMSAATAARGSASSERPGTPPHLPVSCLDLPARRRLRRAREMPAGFDRPRTASCPCRSRRSAAWCSSATIPPAVARDAAPASIARFDLYGWGAAKVAARRTYWLAANWKLVMENYHECYHCAPAHPEFAAPARPGPAEQPHASRPRRTRHRPRRFRSLGRRRRRARSGAGHALGACRRLRDRRRATASRWRPPMGRPARRGTGSACSRELGFLSAFLAYPDHGVIYRFIPRGALDTEMEVIWLVARRRRARPRLRSRSA